MPLEAVLFDLDGTLASFNIDYKTLRVEVKSYLQKRGVPASVLSSRESIFEMLRNPKFTSKTPPSPTRFSLKQKKRL